MQEWELEQEIEELERDLNGDKWYLYMEEVKRDHRRLEKLKKQLKELESRID